MAIQRMDNVLIVVEDLDTVIAFFVERGMELEGRGPVEGRWVERVIGIDNVRQDVCGLLTATAGSSWRCSTRRRRSAPCPGTRWEIRRIMFAVDDMIARLRTHGAELVGAVERFEQIYRLCHVRGPEGPGRAARLRAVTGRRC
jgi:catechol 2,3-dioxygenase-like lactoylglutathione lyase family enzyme